MWMKEIRKYIIEEVKEQDVQDLRWALKSAHVRFEG